MKKPFKILLIIFLIIVLGLAGTLLGVYLNFKHKVDTYIEQLEDEDPKVRVQAAEGLNDIGSALLVFEDNIVPALVEALNDEEEEVKDAVVEPVIIFLMFGNGGILDVIRNHNDPYVREKAVYVIGGFVASAEEPIQPPVSDNQLIEYLIDLLGDEDEDVRWAADRMFYRIIRSEHAPAKKTSELLVQALKNNDPTIRAGAANALGWFETEACPENVVPALNEAMNDEDPLTRVQAAGSIFLITGESGEALPVLIECLKEADEDVLFYVIHYLQSIGPDSKPAIPLLIEVLKTSNLKSRRMIFFTLGRIGPDAIPSLLELLRDNDPALRSGGLRGLRVMKEDAAIALPDIIKAFKDADKDVRIAALKAAGAIGEKAEMAVDPLVKLLEDENLDIQEQAGKTLTFLGKHAAKAIPALLENLSVRDFEKKQPIAEVISSIAEQVGDDTNYYIGCLYTEESSVRYLAAVELGDLGKKAESALPMLREVAEMDGDSDVRAAAREAIVKIEERD